MDRWCVLDTQLVNLIGEDWVEFPTYKIEGAQVMWADTESLDNGDAIAIEKFHRQLLDESAFVIKDTPCFAELPLDLTQSKLLQAERYGGEGIAANGGGGRCGNTEQCQLKGIGANCMVGIHDDLIHKYGGLDAPLAIMETIYTNLLNCLLPLGAVKINALIYTGQKTAIYHHPNNPVWGVIMVRDNCIRPAHFMRASLFKPNAEAEKLPNDLGRVRKLNKKLATHFKNNQQFIMYVGKFLQNCANQFAFARAMRVLHGTVSPSNISIDGKWLDLPMSTLMTGGVNFTISSQFYSEHQGPLKWAIELLHGFSKYNKTTLNPATLVNYYSEQFDAYFRHYIGYVIGVDLALIKTCSSPEWKKLTDAFGVVIHAGKQVVFQPVVLDENDPVIGLIKCLYFSLMNGTRASYYFKKTNLPEAEYEDLTKSFRVYVKSLRSTQNQSAPKKYHSEACFIISSALVAIKRAFLARVFYAKNITDYLWPSFIKDQEITQVSVLIENYKQVGKWIYEEVASSVTLFQSNAIKIVYINLSGEYLLEAAEATQAFKLFDDLFHATQQLKSSFMFEHIPYDFFLFMEELHQIVPNLENNLMGGNHYE
jgi:hypothetical protein